MDQEFAYHDSDALLYRLHAGLADCDKDVVFVVGAPITAPHNGDLGVADVSGVIALIRGEFAGKAGQLEKLDQRLARSDNPYQTAFDFLFGRKGQNAANAIIKKAVSGALRHTASADWQNEIQKLPDHTLKVLDDNPTLWHLSPGVTSLGALIAKYPDRFGKLILTSNFDPLLEVAVRTSGGSAWRTSLSADGSFLQSTATGSQVIHLHGYWYGSDTLHSSRQLVRNRPLLKNDIFKLLEDKIVVVVAYGGWPDIFTDAIAGAVANDNVLPEILWAFNDESPVLPQHLLTTLAPGIDRNRVTLYAGIDCHTFFPQLYETWEQDPLDTDCEPKDSHSDAGPSRSRLFRLAPLDCDRPPSIDVWVGRENELRALETSRAKVAIICGIGGEGKSVLASHYINSLEEREGSFSSWDWRDCKEQSDRIRTQIVEIIVRYSHGGICSEDLAEADDDELVEVLLDHIEDAQSVLVFDNVDSYVDLEQNTFTGLLDKLVHKMAATHSTSRIIATCRPDVHYAPASVISVSLKGLSEEEAIDLFAKRAPSASIPQDDIRDAHAQTKGHAFWLDLMAVQVTKVPGTTLRKLLDDMRRGREDVPDVLSSIWDKLPVRERTLLRFMAEAVRPETEATVQQFASAQLTYKNFDRAFRSLISLNLIVVKPEADAPDLYDLHPLVRQFVRTKYVRAERSGIIQIVINQYKLIIGAIESLLGVNLPLAMLERWSQKAELEVSAGLHDEAFQTLFEVEDAFIGGGHVQEYVRVSRLLFEAIDWETAPTKFQHFDNLVGVVVAALDQLGDYESSDNLIERYRQTIPHKTARYIKLCEVIAYSEWLRGKFDTAVEWAAKGVSLKKETGVDTEFDCKHTLALAQRDAGQPEIAIQQFLGDCELEDLLQDADSISSDGSVFGNVGRCLQMLGRPGEALICLKRSMRILENEASFHTKSNRGYARKWIGQIFASQGDREKAEAFFVDAIRVLGPSAPIRVREIVSELKELNPDDPLVIPESQATRVVDTWMRT